AQYYRTLDGTWNDFGDKQRGSAGQPLVRINYLTDYQGIHGGIISPPTRPNARTLSNALSKQTTSIPSARGLSDLMWGWAQFLDHDMSLSTTSVAAGSAGIAIDDPNDPLRRNVGPNEIAFTRSNFVTLGD